MRQLRQLLRLHGDGVGAREIARMIEEPYTGEWPSKVKFVFRFRCPATTA